MAYQLPPPPYNEDNNTRAWLFELYKRNQDILDNDATIEITGEVSYFGTVVNNAVTAPATIALPYINGISGGSPSSLYPGDNSEADFYGVFGRISPTPNFDTVTTIPAATFATTPAYLTESRGVWVVVTDSEEYWTTTPADAGSWALVTVSPMTSTRGSTKANGSGVVVSMDSGYTGFQYSDDDGKSWTETYSSGGSGYNGVRAIFWNSAISKFQTDGQLLTVIPTIPDGSSVVTGANGSVSSVKGFINNDDINRVYIFGSSGVGLPRNGYSDNGTTWVMSNDMPNTGLYNGVPSKANDRDERGVFTVGCGTVGLKYEYWTSLTGVAPWVSGHRYDTSNTSEIKFIKYIPALEKWILCNSLGEWYSSTAPEDGASSWSVETTLSTYGQPNQSPVGSTSDQAVSWAINATYMCQVEQANKDISVVSLA